MDEGQGKRQGSVMRMFVHAAALLVLIGALASPSSFAQTGKIDSLKTALSTAPEDTGRIDLLNQLGMLYRNRGDYEKAIEVAGQSLTLSQKLLKVYIPGSQQFTACRDGQSQAYSLCGVSRMYEGSYPDAIRYFLQALEIKKELKDKKGMGGCYNNLGTVYHLQGNYPRALENYYLALKLKEESGDLKGIPSTYSNIGSIYLEQENLTEALKIFESGLTAAREVGDKRAISACYNNIGNVHFTGKKFREALVNYTASLEIKEKAGDKYGMALCYNNIGNVHQQLGDHTLAMENHLLALRIREEVGDRPGMAMSYNNIGSLYLVLRNFTEAKAYLEKGLKFSLETKATVEIKTSHELLSQLYTLQGNPEKAYHHYKQFIAYSDSLQNEENTQKQTRLEMQFQFDKQQEADSIRNAEQLKHEALKHEQEIQQQRIYTYGGAAGFLLMLVVAGVSFNAYRQKRRANALILEQKLLVEQKQKEILDSIYYARRIQRSLLPGEKYIHKILSKQKE
jgi:tetratricopeptide (TPR) repeat protein